MMSLHCRCISSFTHNKKAAQRQCNDIITVREELQSRNRRESRQSWFYSSSINNIEKIELTSIVSLKRKTVLIKSRQVCKSRVNRYLRSMILELQKTNLSQRHGRLRRRKRNDLSKMLPEMLSRR